MTRTNYTLLSLFLILSLAINHTALSQDLVKTIPVEGKNLTNLSGSMNDSISFHIIINKIEKEYKSKVHFLDRDQEINSIEIYNDNAKPNYLCFHVNDSTLTLIRESNDKKIIVQDVNYISGKTSFSEINIQPKQIFSHKNITFLVGGNLNQSYPFAFIKNSSDTEEIMIRPKNAIEIEFFSYLKSKTEFVNDKQFLDNGPILKYKGFYNGEDLVFTNDSKRDATTNVLIFKPSGKIINKSVPARTKSGLKRLSSFVKDSLLFTFRMYREESYLDISELTSLKKIKTFHYTKSEFGPHNRVVMRGKDITKSFVPIKFYKDFTPQAIGSMYLPALNISVNKTVSDDYVIRIGHLDENSYNNKATNNFWWNNKAYALNYNLNSGAFSFNGAGVQMMMFKALADAKNTGNYFELNLNKSLEQIENVGDFKFLDIDEKEYDKHLKNIMTLNNQFYIQQKDYVRFINFDKNLEEYKIYNLTKI